MVIPVPVCINTCPIAVFFDNGIKCPYNCGKLCSAEAGNTAVLHIAVNRQIQCFSPQPFNCPFCTLTSRFFAVRIDINICADFNACLSCRTIVFFKPFIKRAVILISNPSYSENCKINMLS